LSASGLSGLPAEPSGDPSRSGNRILGWYGAALVSAATVLLAAGPRASAWSAYALLCEVIGVGAVLRAGVLRVPGPTRLAGLRARVGASAHRLRTALAAAAQMRSSAAPRLGPTQARATRAECTKFLSLRSNGVAPLLIVVVVVGSAFQIAATTQAPPDGWGYLGFNPGIDVLLGVGLCPLALGVLGVLVISADYATGVMRSALTVTPRRMPVLWAKLVAVVAVVTVVALVAIPAAVFVGVGELRVRGWTIELADPRPWTTGCWAAMYMVLVAVIGLSLGALLRGTAAAISALVAMFYVVPIMIFLLPGSGTRWFAPYLPAAAGEAMWGHPLGWHIGSRAVALGVFSAWSGLLFGAATVRFLRQDV